MKISPVRSIILFLFSSFFSVCVGCGGSGGGGGSSGGGGGGIPSGVLLGKVVYVEEVVEDLGAGILISPGYEAAVAETPLANAQVEIVGIPFSAVTDSEGNFKISKLPPTALTIIAKKDKDGDGIADLWGTAQVDLSAGGTNVKVAANDNGEVEGRVTLDGAQTGNMGIMVFIPGTSSVAMTDDEGYYFLEEVPCSGAAITIAAAKSCYSSQTVEVSLPNCGSAVQAAEMSLRRSTECEGQAPPGHGDITGKVFLLGAGDHSGIAVTLNSGENALTSADGGYVFGGLMEGLYRLMASCPGYHPFEYTNIAVFDGATYFVPDIYLCRVDDPSCGLEPLGDVTGLVRESGTNFPLSGALVGVAGSDKVSFTDSTGRFLLTGLPVGPKTLVAFMIGYDGAQTIAGVLAGETVQSDLWLSRPSANTPPSALVISPASGNTFSEGSLINFAGLVEDGEDLPEDLLVRWISSVNGLVNSDPSDVTGLAVFSTSSLWPGTHLVTLRVTDSGRLSGTGQTAITIEPASPVGDEPILCLSPLSLDFGEETATLQISLANCGDGILAFTITDDQAWISAAPVNGSLAASGIENISVTVNRAGLPFSTQYHGSLFISSNGGNNLIAIQMATKICTDGDGDGYYLEAGCGVLADCDDADPDNWTAAGCANCGDADGDSWRVGCDRYQTVNGPDCDDAIANVWLDCSNCADADGDNYGAGASCDLAADCDDTADTGSACHDACSAYYADADADTHGDAATSAAACSAPAGYVADNTDCDDFDADNWENCAACADGDGDARFIGCDRYVDRDGPDCDDAIANVWLDCADCADADGDGYGAGASCDLAGDCDDSLATGSACHDACSVFYGDTDGDNYGDPAASLAACSAPAGYVADNTDCDDSNSQRYPGNTEVLCDGVDQDCDGPADDDRDTDGDDLSYCAGDCDDDDPDNWTSCLSCLDNDGDLWFAGCDAYTTRSGPDCDDEDAMLTDVCLHCEISFETRLSFDSEGSYDHLMVWTGSEYGVCWMDKRDTLLERELYFTRVAPDGTRIGPEIRVTHDPNGKFDTCFIAWSGSEYGLAWSDFRDSGMYGEAYFARLAEDGSKMGADTRVSYEQMNGEPTALVWADSVYALSYKTNYYNPVSEDYESDLYWASLSADGSTNGLPQLVAAENHGLVADLAWTGSEYGILWGEAEPDNDALYFTRLSASGVKIGADQMVTASENTLFDMFKSLCWTGDEFGLVWADFRDGMPEIYFARIGADGNKIGGDVRVTEISSLKFGPVIAWTGDDYGIAWTDHREGNAEIYFTRLSSEGELRGPDLRVTYDPGESWTPLIEWSGADFGVSFNDDRDGNREIYFVRVGPECPGPLVCKDEDLDTFYSQPGCGTMVDCNDLDPEIKFGAAEIICDGIDQNCNGMDDDDLNADGDPVGFCSGDCDDAIANVWLDCSDCADVDGDGFGAGASCDLAGDCDDTADTGAACHDACSVFYGDTDSDTYGDPAESVAACSVAPAGYVADNTDCDPTDGNHWHDCGVCVDWDGDDYGPGCDLGLDCDDSSAAHWSDCVVCLDWDGDDHGAGCDLGDDCDEDSYNHWNDCGVCVDADGDDYGAGCDLGDDCDDAIANVWTNCADCADADGDGYGAGASCDLDPDCDPSSAAHWLDCGACWDEDDDGYGWNCDLGDDCDDTTESGPACHDTCVAYYEDADYDNFGDPAAGLLACLEPLFGYVDDNTDCDPSSAAHWHDCGVCVDADGDGYGEGCDLGADCDDASAAHWNDCGACVDNDGDHYGSDCDLGDDCDETPESGPACHDTCVAYYEDADYDNFGDPAAGLLACLEPLFGYVDDNTDCDPSNGNVYPGAAELCDGIDNQCPGDTGYGNIDEEGYFPGTVLIPAGCFNMGDAFSEGDGDELPVHNVCITWGFHMDVHEVTNAEYKACVDAGSCTEPAKSTSPSRPSYYGNPTYDNFPVIWVEYNQALTYCAWAGKRLPTEAEWEYAARGGLSGKRYPWGDSVIGTEANYWNSGDPWDNDTSEVEYFAANGYGLYDMGGNVREWVKDWYSSTYYSVSPTNDPPGPLSAHDRVVRGGDFFDGTDYLRVSVRDGASLFGASGYVGFRCVASSCSLPPTPPGPPDARFTIPMEMNGVEVVVGGDGSAVASIDGHSVEVMNAGACSFISPFDAQCYIKVINRDPDYYMANAFIELSYCDGPDCDAAVFDNVDTVDGLTMVSYTWTPDAGVVNSINGSGFCLVEDGKYVGPGVANPYNEYGCAFYAVDIGSTPNIQKPYQSIFPECGSQTVLFDFGGTPAAPYQFYATITAQWFPKNPYGPDGNPDTPGDNDPRFDFENRTTFLTMITDLDPVLNAQPGVVYPNWYIPGSYLRSNVLAGWNAIGGGKANLTPGRYFAVNTAVEYPGRIENYQMGRVGDAAEQNYEYYDQFAPGIKFDPAIVTVKTSGYTRGFVGTLMSGPFNAHCDNLSSYCKRRTSAYHGYTNPANAATVVLPSGYMFSYAGIESAPFAFMSPGQNYTDTFGRRIKAGSSNVVPDFLGQWGIVRVNMTPHFSSFPSTLWYQSSAYVQEGRDAKPEIPLTVHYFQVNAGAPIGSGTDFWYVNHAGNYPLFQHTNGTLIPSGKAVAGTDDLYYFCMPWQVGFDGDGDGKEDGCDTSLPDEFYWIKNNYEMSNPLISHTGSWVPGGGAYQAWNVHLCVVAP